MKVLIMGCINCGAADNSYNYLCQNCFLDDHPVILNRGRLKLTVCNVCRTPVGLNGNWESQVPLEDLNHQLIMQLLNLVNREYKLARGIKDLQLQLEEVDETYFDPLEYPEQVQALIMITGQPDPFLPPITIHEPIIINMKYKTCIHCLNKEQPTSIKGKIQIRGVERWKKEIQDVIEQYIADIKRKGNLDQLPIKTENSKDGIDINFGTKAPVETLSGILHEKYAAFLIKTNEAISYNRIKSKTTYRLVISARMPRFKIGDIIKGPNFLIQILSMTGRRVRGYEYYHNEERELNNELMWDNLTNLFLEYNDFPHFQVLHINPQSHSIQLMTMKNYEIFEISLDLCPDVNIGNYILGFFVESDYDKPKRFYINKLTQYIRSSDDVKVFARSEQK